MSAVGMVTGANPRAFATFTPTSPETAILSPLRSSRERTGFFFIISFMAGVV
jgi:hypothetical protein